MGSFFIDDLIVPGRERQRSRDSEFPLPGRLRPMI